MISPTLGRIVWFTPQNQKRLVDYDIMPDSSGMCAAMVVAVHSDRCVNLAVFDANGAHHAVTSVTLLQDDDVKPADGRCCEWMPYQKGQAAKSEAKA